MWHIHTKDFGGLAARPSPAHFDMHDGKVQDPVGGGGAVALMTPKRVSEMNLLEKICYVHIIIGMSTSSLLTSSIVALLSGKIPFQSHDLGTSDAPEKYELNQHILLDRLIR